MRSCRPPIGRNQAVRRSCETTTFCYSAVRRPVIITCQTPHKRSGGNVWLTKQSGWVPSAIQMEAQESKQSEDASSISVRPFNYASDLQDLLDICASVYGGSDYMPRIIHSLVKRDDVVILAASSESSDMSPSSSRPERVEGTSTSEPPHDPHISATSHVVGLSEWVAGPNNTHPPVMHPA